MPSNFHIIKGALKDSNGKPQEGLIIRLIDYTKPVAENRLGQSVSDAVGEYLIRYRYMVSPRSKPDIQLEIYDKAGKLLQKSDKFANVGKTKTIHLTLNGATQAELSQPVLNLSGSVTTASGRALHNLVVEVVDLNVASLLNSGLPSSGTPVLSREDGGFAINLPDSFGNASSSNTSSVLPTDVMIRVSDPEGNELLTYDAFDLTANNPINIVVPDDVLPPLRPEFERLVNKINSHLGDDFDPSKLNPNNAGYVIDSLARNTQSDARLVAMQFAARRYGEQNSNIPADFYYVLFRSGLPANDDELYRTNIDQALEAYQSAIENNVVSSSVSARDIKTAWLARANPHILASKNSRSLSVLDDMLSLSLKTNKQKNDFVNLYYHGETDARKTWENIEAKFDTNTVKALKLDSQLGFVTFNNAGLIKTLKQDLKVKDPKDLVKHGLYQADKWNDFIDDNMLKDWGTGESLEDKRLEYKQWMSTQLRISYPTAVIADKINTQSMMLNATAGVRKEVVSALNQEGLVLGEKSINQQINDIEASGVTLSEPAKEQFQRVGRTYQLSPDDESMAIMLKNDFDSAVKITSHSKAYFIQVSGLEASVATSVYDKAYADVSMNTNMITSYLTQRANPLPAFAGVIINNSTPDEAAATVKTYPNLEELFGSLDFCSCEHCNSVLSAAAYLVDLLQFIDLTDNNGDRVRGFTGNNPIDQLFIKRPDIEHLQLTCENTNIVLPYIDLVNEVLEFWIAPDKKFSDFEGYNIAPETDSQTLLSTPQHVNSNAYVKLALAVYPFALPFDKTQQQNKAYFNHLNTSLAESMENLRVDEKYSSWKEILFAQLGFSKQAVAILINSDHSWKKLLGLKANQTIENAKHFTKKMAISNEELLELLKTRFINPNKELSSINTVIQLTLKDSNNSTDKLTLNTCDFSKLEIVNHKLEATTSNIIKTSLSKIEYLKFVRFIRISKHFGWSIEHTDQIISTLIDWNYTDEVTLNQNFEKMLVALALFERIKTALNLKDASLLVMWQGFGQNSIEIMDLKLNDIAGISAYQSLAAALSINLEALLDLMQLSNTDPFAVLEYPESNDDKFTLPAIMKFISYAKKIETADFSLAQISYLFSGKDKTGQAKIKQEEWSSLHTQLHNGLIEIDQQYPLEGQLGDEKTIELITAVYGQEASEALQNVFGRHELKVSYDHSVKELSASMKKVSDRITYDDDKHALSFMGLMSTKVRDELKATTGAGSLEDAIDELFNKSEAFKAEDKTYLHSITIYPEIATLHDNHASLADLVQKTLPSLRKKLKASLITQTLGQQLGVTVEMIDRLLVGKGANGDYLISSSQANSNDMPVLDDFEALNSNGITKEDKAWNFYLAPEATAVYHLSLGNLSNAVGDVITITVTIEDHDDDPKTEWLLEETIVGSRWQSTEPLNLKAGKLYRVEIVADRTLKNAVLKWKIGDQLIEEIPATRLFPFTQIEGYKDSYQRLLKALQWIQSMALSAAEVSFYGNNSVFSRLPIKPDVAHSHVLFNSFISMLDYLSLKKQLGVVDDALLHFIKKPDAVYQVEENDSKKISTLYQFVLWNKADTLALVEHFTPLGTLTPEPVPYESALGSVTMLAKTANVFTLLTKTGLSADDLIKVTTGTGNSTLHAALEPNYTQSDWSSLSKNINDKLRVRQRDALVAYVLEQLSDKTNTQHIDTADKLFEYFLIDVQMDACMKTSRIKQAISSVQLFVNRCLHNLEPEISTSAIDAKQWEWRKRYRVWEANRKVFLHPENWLDPALRSSKSAFFKEFEGELLQADINDDLATKALLGYLEKVDRISQLEVVGMCREDKDTIHVIARTPGMKKEYYHRRNNGNWSPWEKITLDVEDGPVIPVWWKDRLFLFWTTVLQKGQNSGETSISANKTIKISGTPKLKIEVNLNWSEYYNDKWQEKRTSDFNQPMSLKVEGEFDRNSIILKYKIDYASKKLLIAMTDKLKKTLRGLLFNNTHGVPQTIPSLYDARSSYGQSDLIRIVNFSRVRGKEENNLKITSEECLRYIQDQSVGSGDHCTTLLLDNKFKGITDFSHHSTFGDPFFLNDYQHAFYVDIDKKLIAIEDNRKYGSETRSDLIQVKDVAGIVPEDLYLIDQDFSGPVRAGPDPAPEYLNSFIFEEHYFDSTGATPRVDMPEKIRS